ncbi:DUF4268 domain-containing protein [Humitalea sp. 24SJ18S-53]|uniref:DUF4268 domain-containing protein n=1 Tax=Humitalea sp. 24SJ18S-53 TaxID=3422307 RepID=UPI003D673F83
MPIYEARPDGLVPLAGTSFEAEGWRERGDIQRLLKDRIASLEDGLMVLAEEFSAWTDSTRRIDLLCLDHKANLVVVELKRNDDGGHMDLQALRYAAMVSAMTFDQAVETLTRSRNRANPDTDAARADILNFLGWRTPDEDNFATETRIVLAAADFGKELTTSVLWLRERGIDIRCVRLKPYRLSDGRLLLDIQQIIPLPEAADFQTRLEEKKAAERKERSERATLMERFLNALSERAAERTPIHRGRAPDLSVGVLGGATGRSGISLNYVTMQQRTRVELLMQGDNGKDQMRRLREARESVEATFGGPLEWYEKEGSSNFRIFFGVEGGYRSPPDEWPAIHTQLIDAMIRLDAAVRPRIAQLP